MTGRALLGALVVGGLLAGGTGPIAPLAAEGVRQAGAGAGSASAALATGSAAPDTADCELRLDPAAVPIREAAVLVSARASADPGTLREVTFPLPSGVVVLNAAPAPNSDEVVARMALDTSEATTGRWTVLLRGSDEECRGTLRILEPGSLSPPSG